MGLEEQKVTNWIVEGLALGQPSNFSNLSLLKKVIESLNKISPIVPPLGIVSDLVNILTKKYTGKHQEISNLEMSTVYCSYEEQFLGRILSDYRLEQCKEIISNLNPSLVPVAIATFIDQICLRLKINFQDSPSSSIEYRVLMAFPLENLIDLVNNYQGNFLSQKSSYESLIKVCRQVGGIISDSEIYVLENIDVLTSNSQRVAITMIADVAQMITRHFPNQTGKKRDRGNVNTNLNDASSYPIGGFSGISTSGDIESLVGSELIYMEDGEEIDLFDIKYTSNELLKYLRDESVHTREKRSIFFFFGDLSIARRKDPSLPYQRIVLLMGGILAGIQKLIKWLEASDLHIELVFEGSLLEEQKLMNLLLREHIKKGILTINLGTLEKWQPKISEKTETSLVDVVRIQTQELSREWVFPEEYLEYIFQIQGSPIFHNGKKTLESGTNFLDWAKLFSLIFQGMV